jgi:glycosyltransferase involved in cell wall biosynthesis
MKKSVVILVRNAARTDFGGGERVPVFIGREMIGHDRLTPLIFSRSEKLLDFAKSSGVQAKKTWWWSKQNWSGLNALLLPAYVIWQCVLFLYYVSLFARYRPVAVHLQSKDDFIAGTFAARLLRARVIWSDHSDLKHVFKNHQIWYKNLVGKTVYLAAYFTEKIVVVSKEDLRLISEEIPEGPVRKRMEIVYNGAFDSYVPVVKNETFTFISTGRLVRDKGIGELIDAFIKFNSKYSESQLHLLGDGPERSLFEEQAAGHGAIHFYGYQKNPLEFVAKAHIFLLPTYHEGFSLAIVEACMLAMPVIATDVGGNPEIIHDGETGLLVKVKDSDSLFSAMEKLYLDAELRNRLAENARIEYVGNFNYANIIRDNYISFYERSL